MGARGMGLPFSAPRGAESRVAVGIGGIVASLLIHALLIQAVLWGARGHASSPHLREGLGANSFGQADEAIATLFFVEDSSASAATDDESWRNLGSAGKVLQSLRVTILSLDPSIDAALKQSDPEEQTPTQDEQSAGEREARAALFGRYLAQIQARIERAWQRPRTQIGADVFDCRVQVLQTERGEVQEITLQRCNGSAQWQQSLVRAIERASPLPTPPDAAVFSNSILMTFQAQPYVSGSEPELYEPETPPSTAASFAKTTYLSEGH